jgi:hypothetical protein
MTQKIKTGLRIEIWRASAAKRDTLFHQPAPVFSARIPVGIA